MSIVTNRTSSLMISIILLAILCTVAAGKIIYVDDDAAGANNGSSWENAYPFLQDALAGASSAEKRVEIRVAQGFYKPNRAAQIQPSNPRQASFSIENGVTLMGGYAGLSEPDPNKRDTQHYKSILSGDLNGDDILTENLPWILAGPTRIDNSYHVVDIRSMNDPVVLDGFTIMGGNAADNEIYPCWSPDLFGGGLRSHANGEGGQSELIIRNCIFKSNSANNSGGAIDYHSDCPLTVVNCEFEGNYATNGGAIEADSEESSTLYLIGCNFVGNSAVCGGAVSNDTRRSSTKTTCLRKVEMTGCTFIKNRAQYGGAVYIMAEELELSECLFAGNRAGQFFWTINGLGLPVVTNESSSGAFGGSFYIAGYIGAVITNCTFASNSAPNSSTATYDSGHGTSLGTLQLHNCILWDEENQIYNDNDLAIVVEYSNVRGGWEGEGNIDTDPMFAAPGYWDPNTSPDDVNDDFWIDGDYHLKSQAGRWDPASESWVTDDVTSPCIDAGDPLTPVMYEPHPRGCFINMGAYGGTEKASKSIVN